MAQCGHNLGPQILHFLTFCVILIIVNKGHCDYADEFDDQHGGFEDWFLEESDYKTSYDNNPDIFAALGRQIVGVANVDDDNDLEDKGSAIFKIWGKQSIKPVELFHQQLKGKPNQQIKIARRSASNAILQQDIPMRNRLFVKFDEGIVDVSDEQLDEINEILASVFVVPKSNIFLYSKTKSQRLILELYIVKAGINLQTARIQDLMAAQEMPKNLNILKAFKQDLRDDIIDDVFSVYPEDQVMLSADNDVEKFVTWYYFPYVAACAGLILITLVISLTWYCAFRGHGSKSSEYTVSGSSSSSPSSHVPQQICTLFPSGKPDVHNPTAIQPNLSHILSHRSMMGVSGSGSGSGSPSGGGIPGGLVGIGGSPLHLHGSVSPYFTGSLSPRSMMSGTPCSSPSSGTPLTGSSTPIHTPPMRIRAKLGLLERRGSNASLTLELGQPTGSSQDTSSSWGSPPRESSAEEFLLSAGNRMSRKQLRNCLKNVRAVHEEFWEIPMNHPDRIEVAGSGMKNRYRTIIPNEETRVKILSHMEEEGISSYINANYIRGYASEPRSYIATQGPMSNTVSDFWHMVWQEKAPIIVMITKLREKNRTKCESYIPETSTQFDDIEVKTNSISERNGYILRILTIKCGDKEHTVQHYWYTAWPDHKAPNTAKTLLDLVKLVDQQRYDSRTGKVKGPVIIHCSAGIGRTGCFIAASIGIQQLRGEHMVDVLGIICSMRLDRGGMIQTNEQYEFLHQTLCLFERELPERPPSDGAS